MSTSPFGAAGFGIPPFDPADWQRAASQWFAAMTPPAAPQAAPDPFAWWRQAQPPATPDPMALASQWLAQVQQLAARFSGRDASAADITRAWRELVGENPFASMAAASAFMPASLFAGGQQRGPFDMPAFGYAREHQERLQDFAKALAGFQEASQAFQAIVAEAGRDAFARFESLLERRAADGAPVETARALFDLWIDAAEDAYADIALGERFQQAFGDYVNAQTRVRAAMQKEVELAGAQWGIPGREEVDAAHRKIAELQREVRRLRETVDAMRSDAPKADAADPAADAPKASKKAARARKPASKKPGAR